MRSSIGENIAMIETSVTASKIVFLPATKDSIHLLCIISIISIIIIISINSIISIIISIIILTIIIISIIIISIITIIIIISIIIIIVIIIIIIVINIIIIIIIIIVFLHRVRYAGPMGTIRAHLHFSDWRPIRLQQSAESRNKVQNVASRASQVLGREFTT